MVPTRDVSRQRRGAAVADAVLHATVELLGERGYAVSVDDVAQRANVHKTTIYRRYATKAALVGAAIDGLATSDVPTVNTSDPLADLAALAVSVANLLASPAGARILRAVVAAAGDDAEVLTASRRFLAGRFDVAAEIIARAVSTGHLRAGVDPILLWGAIVNPLHLRALLGYPVTESAARDLVALVVDGARAAPVS